MAQGSDRRRCLCVGCCCVAAAAAAATSATAELFNASRGCYRAAPAAEQQLLVLGCQHGAWLHGTWHHSFAHWLHLLTGLAAYRESLINQCIGSARRLLRENGPQLDQVGHAWRGAGVSQPLPAAAVTDMPKGAKMPLL